MRRSLGFAVISGLTFILLAGCTSMSPEWEALYDRLSEDPEEFDPGVLEGRRIVIDPGHGGRFRGAMGVDSLAEADANLGVALYLWGMLDEAGADVRLTRSTDRDFLSRSTGGAGSEELREDLERRMALVDSLVPEVFLSIHHNSNLARDRKRNRVEVYYRGDDPRASLELAEEIHLHLARNLGIAESTIRPGNYFVLRESPAGASVLGEASYISNPGVEDRLKISTRQRLEAEAYYLGILSYFMRGVPRIEALPGAAGVSALPGSIGFTVRRGAGVPLDPASIRAMLGETEAPSAWDPISGVLSFPVPADIPNGIYTLRATARSVRGATASSTPVKFTVDRPVRFILPLRPERTAGGLLLTVRLLDELGGEVLDGKKVRAVPVGRGSIFRGAASRGSFSFEVPPERSSRSYIFDVEGVIDTLSFPPPGLEGLSLRVVDSSSGEPVPDAVLAMGEGRSSVGDADGRLYFPPVLSGQKAFVRATGYRPFPVGPSEMAILARSPLIRIDPVLGGILHAKRIAIDPAPGQELPGTGPDLLRASTVNMEIARRTGSILSAAGALVSYTRLGEETLSTLERVARVSGSGAQFALGLRFGSSIEAGEGVFTLLHYPGSSGGILAAGILASLLPGLPPCVETRVSASAGAFLQQTPCPACELHAPVDGLTEDVFRNPAWLEMQAGMLAEAIISWFAGGSAPCSPHTFLIESGGRPVDGAVVSLDGVFSAVTAEGGLARFRCVDGGTHQLQIGIPGDGGDVIRTVHIDPAGPEGPTKVETD